MLVALNDSVDALPPKERAEIGRCFKELSKVELLKCRSMNGRQRSTGNPEDDHG
jgi:hypothetical protein